MADRERPMRYAEGTVVSVAKSQQEISTLLTNAGAAPMGFQFHDDHAIVAFTLTTKTPEVKKDGVITQVANERKTHVMMRLELPARAKFAKKKVHGWMQDCSSEEQTKRWEQACRERWRALVLVLKAKLVSVESKVETVEEAFLAHLVVNDAGRSRRFADVIVSQMIAHQNGGGRLLLGSGS